MRSRGRRVLLVIFFPGFVAGSGRPLLRALHLLVCRVLIGSVRAVFGERTTTALIPLIAGEGATTAVVAANMITVIVTASGSPADSDI